MSDMSPRRNPPSGPIRTVSALLTAVPGFFGFIPTRSLILLALAPDGRTIQASVRIDLDLRPDGTLDSHMLAEIDHLAAILQGYGSADVIAVVADDRSALESPIYRAVVSVVDRRMWACGGVGRGYVCSRFGEGERWIQVWEEGAELTLRLSHNRGVLSDPRISPTAVSDAVHSGRLLLGTREEIEAMLDPTSHCDDPCCVSDSTCISVSTCISDSTRCPVVEAVLDADATPQQSMAAIHEAIAVRRLRFDCASIAELERAVCDLRVRDAALAFAVTDLRTEAEALWRELTRRLSGTGRASAATLLAHLHYIGGEGSFAGVALDVALDADPEWSLARLLDRSLRNGLRPDSLWEIIGDSYDAAAALGVIIPSATLRDAS